jgi:carbon-monoxide dehydrogenase large subunit
MIYDAEGNPLTTTVSTTNCRPPPNPPDLEYGHVVTPARTPGGYKGMGEGGAIASPAALGNAVRDALAPLGVNDTAWPLTPSRILEIIQCAETAGDAPRR